MELLKSKNLGLYVIEHQGKHKNLTGACVITSVSNTLEVSAYKWINVRLQMAQKFSWVRGLRRADHCVKAWLSTADVTIRGSKELLSNWSSWLLHEQAWEGWGEIKAVCSDDCKLPQWASESSQLHAAGISLHSMPRAISPTVQM